MVGAETQRPLDSVMKPGVCVCLLLSYQGSGSLLDANESSNVSHVVRLVVLILWLRDSETVSLVTNLGATIQFEPLLC